MIDSPTFSPEGFDQSAGTSSVPHSKPPPQSDHASCASIAGKVVLEVGAAVVGGTVVVVRPAGSDCDERSSPVVSTTVTTATATASSAAPARRPHVLLVATGVTLLRSGGVPKPRRGAPREHERADEDRQHRDRD